MYYLHIENIVNMYSDEYELFILFVYLNFIIL